MDTQRASSSSAPTSFCWKYDVFLSFRGEDTRRNFTSHLYNALIVAGVNVFMDDKELEKGKQIRAELLQAIQESRFLIIVFSKNYASSSWCLDELSKIVECISTGRQTVIPVFYDVDPSVVRKQIGEFQEVFVRHEETFKENKNIVQTWREALKKVADNAGYDLRNRNESEVVQEIVKEISTRLSFWRHMNLATLVGLDSRVEELQRLIGVGSNVGMIGICGMGGIGKTTIARVIYDLIYSEFEGSCFLANVRENSKNDKKIISLQKKLLCETLKRTNINISDVSSGINEIRRRLHNKKVLLVIDDVTHVNQLRSLAGERDWFGPRSRIIITTRDESLLRRVDQVYRPKLLNDDDAPQLFCLNAFQTNEPPEDYWELSKSVVNHSGGLPLALVVLGTYLGGITCVDVWKSAIERLSKEPKGEIINKLKISFDGIESSEEKKIFLDIACFFKGESLSYVTNILNACGFSATIGITSLVQRHLINMDSGKLWMHDLLEEMGREIINRESLEPGQRSRLFKKEDICHVLRENTGTEVVEGIMIKEDLKLRVGAEAFSKMINLRYLKIKNLQLPEGLNRLSNNLRLLEWDGYPLKSLPASLELDKISELKLHHSNIEQLWKGVKQLSMLRSISLKDCQKLNEIPDLTCAPNLQELFIEGCPKVYSILSPSRVHKECIPLKQLSKLRSIRLKDCQKLNEIPDLTCAPNLQELFIIGSPKVYRILSPSRVHKEFIPLKQLSMLRSICLIDCRKLNEIPDLTCAPNLQELFIERCPIAYGILSPSRVYKEFIPLKQLKSLSLRNCEKLIEIPDLTTCFPKLWELYIQGCPRLRSIHSPLLVHENLREFFVRQCNRLMDLPSKIHMKSLCSLVINGCPGLEQFPEIVGSMYSLTTLGIKGTAIKEMQFSDELLPELKSLVLSNNNKLVTLPSTLGGLKRLNALDLRGCSQLKNVQEPLGQVERLFLLRLDGTAITQVMSSTFSMKNLEILTLRGCKGSPPNSYFSFTPRRSSDAMALTLPSLSDSACFLRTLDLSDCNLREEDIPCYFFASLISLKELNLSSNNFASLPATINCLSKLERLYLEDCSRLQSLTELPPSRREVALNSCASPEVLSGAFKFLNSRAVYIDCANCFKLVGGNKLMFSMLKDYLKAPDVRREFSMIAPGVEIPEWVRHQSKGSSVTMERPPNLDNNKLVGVVACCVLVSHSRDIFVPCSVTVDAVGRCRHTMYRTPPKDKSILESGHIWLLYFDLDDYDRLTISVSIGGCPVKMCGVHPIYEKDLNDFNPGVNQSSSSSLGYLSESSRPQDFTGSEESSESDGDDPPPKRLKLFKFPFF